MSTNLYLRKPGVLTPHDGAMRQRVAARPLSAAFYAHRDGTDQTIPGDSTPTKVLFTHTDFNFGGHFDNTTNHRFIVPRDGLYHFSWATRWSSPIDQQHISAILYRNGTGYRATYGSASGTTNYSVVGHVLVSANAGQYFELWVQHNISEGSDTLSGANSGTWFCGRRVD